MTRFQRFLRWIRGENYPETLSSSPPHKSKLSCCHGPATGPVQVRVLGKMCEFNNSPLCERCTEEYLNRFSTRCASCDQPIFPGNSVGQAWIGADHPYTHLTFDCCMSAGLWCGCWGEGKLITLHEIDPANYPPGETSIVSMVASSWQARPIQIQ